MKQNDKSYLCPCIICLIRQIMWRRKHYRVAMCPIISQFKSENHSHKKNDNRFVWIFADYCIESLFCYVLTNDNQGWISPACLLPLIYYIPWFNVATITKVEKMLQVQIVNKNIHTLQIFHIQYVAKSIATCKKNPYIINQNHIFSKNYCEVISG